MKRIAALLAAAVLLTACNKFDAVRIDGTFRSDARQEIVIRNGTCVSFQEDYTTGDLAIKVTGFKTSGSWPDYTFTAKGQPDYSTVGTVTNFTIQAHFKDADTFTATAGGIITSGGVSTAIPADQFTFKRVSANFQQTETGTN